MTTDVVTAAEPAAAPQVAGLSLRQLAWRRLKRDKAAMFAMWLLIFIFGTAILAPLITNLLGVNPYDFDLTVLDPSQGSLPAGAWGGISLEHPLGVEPLTGRDLLARLLFGARVSLLIAISAVAIIAIVGTTIGIVAGYKGGWIDTLIGRLTDLILAFPLILMLIALSPVLTQRLQAMGMSPEDSRVVYLIIVFAFFGWPYLARLIRGQVLSLREREFVEAAVASGAPTRRILFREVLPNLWAPIIVYVTISIPTIIASEAALSYLGVGIIEPTPSWGKMLADSVRYFAVVPTYLFIPGTALFIVVYAFNIFGDAVRDALDPRTGRNAR
ncbi:MAG: ABC transporter permease subunit [Actinomycetales bacterium]|nr:ABC transporter permease subunit [Actinomycetales bacterium]